MLRNRVFRFEALVRLNAPAAVVWHCGSACVVNGPERVRSAPRKQVEVVVVVQVVVFAGRCQLALRQSRSDTEASEQTGNANPHR